MTNSKYIICSKCGRTYNACSVRICRHEAVNKIYGENICLDCCKKCKHHTQAYIGEGCELLDKIRTDKQKKKPRKEISVQTKWEVR